VLGALVAISALRFLAYGWVDELFVKPTFFFKYWGFSWVSVLPPPGMHVVFGLLFVLGVLFAAGVAHRIVAPVLCLLFAYVQLVDVTNWLNHYYLVGLLLLLTTFMPLGRGIRHVPAWCTYLLRFQVGVVYVYAGLAKLTGDWLLHAAPLDIWLHARTDVPVLGAFFGTRGAAYAFAWGGFLFDTTVVGFLLWRRSRPWAYAVLVAFHATVGLLFPIGMFPLIMTSAALVFFEPSWPRRLLALVVRRDGQPSSPPSVEPSTPARAPSRVLACFAVVYCVLQILVPLRHRLYGGDVLWHEQGMRFSWKVMVREKNGSITYLVDAPAMGRSWYVDPRRYLTDRQERELSSQPDLVLQLAHHIKQDFAARGYPDVRVRAEAIVSLNGRPGAPMIDPAVDLAMTADGWAKASWILPAPAGPPIHLRSRPWPAPRIASR